MADTASTPNSNADPDFAAYVGLDWADRKHCWKLVVAGSAKPESGELANTPEALQAWAAELRGRFPGRPVAVALEQRRGSVVFQMSKFPHLVLFPVHPNSLANYRHAFFPSGNKNDPIDATLLLEILVHHRDRLRRLQPDTPETRLLQLLVEQRRTLVDEKTRHSNRLTAALKTYYPQALDWFDDIDSPLGCAFLQRWPTLEKAQRAHPGTLRRFFIDHNCRSQDLIRRRIEGIHQATAAVDDPALLQAGEAWTLALAAILTAIHEQIDAFDEQIDRAMQAHPEADLFASVPGAGRVLLPRLLAAFGTDRNRYASAAELQNYTGIAPVRSQTGNTEMIRCRRAYPKFPHQTFHELAAHSIGQCGWARAFYDSQRATHHHYHAALRALAFKWQRILFACWRDRKPYHEQIYVQSLQKRNSPLLKLLTPEAPDTKVTWIPVAGFHKLATKNP